MVKGLDLVRVRALRVFTRTTPHGQFHGNPDGSTERTRLPLVPDYVVDGLVASGNVERITGAPARASVPALHAPDAAGSPFTMEHKGFGKYLIAGPGVAPGTYVKGKADAETFIATLEAAHAPDAAGESDDAPID